MLKFVKKSMFLNNRMAKLTLRFKSMSVGVPKEIFQGEKRVSVTPEGVKKLKKMGYDVFVEQDAGLESKFSNDLYQKSGAEIVTESKVFSSDILLKVNPPTSKEEVLKMKRGQTLMSFVYPGRNEELLSKF